MNLKKIPWVIELLIIIAIISLINLAVTLIGYRNIYTIMFCQLINLIGFVALLWLASFRLINLRVGGTWSNFLRKRITIIDILIVIVLLFLSKSASFLIMKIKIIEVFNYELFRGFSINHLSITESWLLFFVLFVSLTIGGLAEEFYFRSYLFEIQYKYFKNYTWIVNGFLWSVYHIFSPTNFLVILPQSLMYSYVYQKRRNIWITIVAHLISNYMVLYFRMKHYL